MQVRALPPELEADVGTFGVRHSVSRPPPEVARLTRPEPAPVRPHGLRRPTELRHRSCSRELEPDGLAVGCRHDRPAVCEEVDEVESSSGLVGGGWLSELG